MDNTFNQAFKPITNTKSIKEYETEIDSLNNLIFELKSKLAQNSSNVGQGQAAPMYEINDVLCNSRTAIKMLEDENANLKYNIEKLKMPLKERNIVENENKRLNENMRKIVHDYELKIDSLTNENNLLRNELHNFKENIAAENYSGKIANLKNEKQSLMKEPESKRDKYNSMMVDFQSRINKQEIIYQKNMDDAQKVNEDMRNQILSCQNCINEKNNQILQYENKYNQLYQKYQADTSSHAQELQILQNQKNIEREKYEEKIALISKQLNILTADKKELENSKSLVEKEIEDIKRGMMNYHGDLEVKNLNLESRNNELREKIKKIADLEQVVKNLEISNNKIRKEYSYKVDDMKEQKERLNTKLSNLESELDAYKKKAEIYYKQRNDLSKKCEQYKDEYQVDKENKTNKTFIYEKNKELEKTHSYLREKIKERDDFINFNLNETKSVVQEINSTIKRYNENLLNMKTRITILDDKIKKSGSFKSKQDQHLTVKDVLNTENLNFIRSNFPYETNINEIVRKMARIFTKMNEKIYVLENDANQLTQFAEKNVNDRKEQTNKIIDEFIVEFKNAKIELEFCKNYLKEKSKALKDLKNERLSYQNKIKDLECQIESLNSIKEKKPSFFSRLY